MGTKAKHMDCDGMIQKASQLASKGNDVQNALKEAYSRIESMRDGDAWTGATYDGFVINANNAVARLNKIIKDVVSVLPHDIAVNAQGIAQAGNVTPSVSFQDQSPITLQEMPLTSKGNIWDFDSDVTKSNQEAIKAKFDQIKSITSDCQNLADQLKESMNSGNGVEKATQLKSAYTRLGQYLDLISRSLTESVQAQTELFNATESALATKDKITEATKETVDNIVEGFSKASDAVNQKMSDIRSYFIY